MPEREVINQNFSLCTNYVYKFIIFFFVQIHFHVSLWPNTMCVSFFLSSDFVKKRIDTHTQMADASVTDCHRYKHTNTHTSFHFVVPLMMLSLQKFVIRIYFSIPIFHFLQKKK